MSGWSEVPINDAPSTVRFLVGQVRRGKDAMVAFHGPEGGGKSTTAKNLALELERILGVKAIVIFNQRQLLMSMLSGKKGQIYLLDEAINIFHNQDWSTWIAKALTKIIRQMRIMRSLWLLCVPDFEGLHPYLRESRIFIRFYHPPQWDSDGLGNGPAKLLFKQERFDYKTGMVQTRWNDAGDITSHCLDDHPDQAQYELDKIANFKELVKDVVDRLDDEESKAKTKKKRTTKKGAAVA